MKGKQKLLMCPSCGKQLLRIEGSCSKMYIICDECSASLLFNIDEDGCMRISVRPSDYNSGANEISTSDNV